MCFYFIVIDTKNPVVYANWFDKSGVRNSFPVNSKKPSANIYLNYTIWSYLDKKKQLFFQTSGTGQYKLQSGYQSLMELDGLGDTSFDYALFLSKIYGGASGEKFYNGESGFKESRTNIIDANAFVYALYRTGALSVNLKIGANYYGSRYSLVKKRIKTFLSCTLLRLSRMNFRTAFRLIRIVNIRFTVATEIIMTANYMTGLLLSVKDLKWFLLH